jgi:superfamily II DNA/RNA helicase
MPRTLILEPTRELAAQVRGSFIKYGAKHKLNVALMIGGVSFDDQDAKLTRGVDVLIATPGRLLDHSSAAAAADRRRTAGDRRSRPHARHGLHPDIERICKLVPFTRQTCSSPRPCRRKSSASPSSSCTIRCASRSPPATTVATTTQILVKTGREPHEKRDTLRQLIRSAKAQERDHLLQPQARGRAAAPIAGAATASIAAALHGDMDQPARTAALDQFRKARSQLLIASDVAAAGSTSRSEPRLQFRRAAHPTTTCTASAAPAAPGAPAPRSPSWRRSTRKASRRSKS